MFIQITVKCEKLSTIIFDKSIFNAPVVHNTLPYILLGVSARVVAIFRESHIQMFDFQRFRRRMSNPRFGMLN